MKTGLCTLLMVCAVLLIACAPAAPEATLTPEPLPTVPDLASEPLSPDTETAEVPVSATSAGKVTMDIRTEAKDFYSEDYPDTLLLSFSADLPRVTIPGADQAATAINAALQADYDLFVNGNPNGEEGVVTGVDTFLSRAREDLAHWAESDNLEGFVYFILQRETALTRGDSQVVSLTCEDTTGLGGVHPYVSLHGQCFDARTGGRLDLSGLAEDSKGFLAACEEKLLEISRDKDHADYMYFDDYEETLPKLLEGDAWYFDDRGIVIAANPYDIAPYAAGRIDFLLTYDWLARWIGAEYLPA